MSHHTSSRRSPPTCSFWLRGVCNKGSTCGYAHTQSPAAPPVQPTTTPSGMLTLTSMPLDANTPVPIGLISLPTSFPPSSKSTPALIPHQCRGSSPHPIPSSKLKLCSYFESSGICSRGTSCHYAHGRLQLKCSICGNNAYLQAPPPDLGQSLPSSHSSHKPALSIRTIPTTSTSSSTSTSTSTSIPSITNKALDAIQRRKQENDGQPADLIDDTKLPDDDIDNVMTRFVDITWEDEVHLITGILKLRVQPCLTTTSIPSHLTSEQHQAYVTCQQYHMSMPSIVICDNMIRANQCIETYMMNETLVGFDMEWRPTSNPRVALVQLSSSRMIVLIRMHTLKTIPPSLLKLLNRTQCVKAGVDIGKDLDILRNTYPSADIRGSSLLSLDTVYRCMDGLTSPGLATLAEIYCGVVHPKTETVRMSDWQARHLTGAQVSYAATDAWLSYALAHALTSRPAKIRFTSNNDTKDVNMR